MIFGLIEKPNTSKEISSILSSRMKRSGFSFAHISQCSDTDDSLKSCVLAALSRCDVVIIVMPLGPKTQARSIVADALDIPMEYSKRALKHLRAYFEGDMRRSEEFSDCAWLPSGSRVLLGNSPIPACACLADGKAIFLIDEEYDVKVMDLLIAFCLSIESSALTSEPLHEEIDNKALVGAHAALVFKDDALLNEPSKTNEISSTRQTFSSSGGMLQNKKHRSPKHRFLSARPMVFLVFMCAALLFGIAMYDSLPGILAAFNSDENSPTLSNVGTVVSTALAPSQDQGLSAASISNQSSSDLAQPSSEATPQVPASTNSASQSTSIASSSQAAKPASPSPSSAAAPPAVSKPPQEQQVDVIEIDSPFITDDRTSQSNPPQSTMPAASSSSTPVSTVNQPSQAPAPRPPQGQSDETFFFIANGRRQTMDAFDLVCAIVQNETNGILDTDALKAQAVASYTYMLHHNAAGVAPSVGINTAINDKVRSAVSAVFGQTIRYNGSYINATYYSTSSGKTTSAQSVWGSNIPYLVSVDSSQDRQAPKFQQTVQVDANRFAELVSQVYGIVLDGNPSEWIVARRDAPGEYVGSVTLGGFTLSQGGSFGNGRPITGRSIRESLMSFTLRSHCFVVSYAADRNAFLFTTFGYGHGVGMSQYGAHFMSLEGRNYLEILRHYYPGTTVS